MTLVPRTAVIVVTLLAFAGCAVVQPVTDLSPASIRQQVRPGDVVQVTVTGGRTFDLDVEKVEEASLTGTTVDNRRFRIAYASITGLTLRDPGQAAAAAAGLTILAVLAPIALLILLFD